MNPETGVGDDNRTAVSDEELEAGYQAVAGIVEDYGAITRADVRLALEAAAAARRDVPGGRSPIYDGVLSLIEDETPDNMPYMTDVEVGAYQALTRLAARVRALASHPLERADSERDA